MKKLALSIFFLLALTQAQAEGIKFSTLNWKQLSEQAKSSNKIIFVDFYTTWCGPCKYLEKEVFTHADVGSYFNEHFSSIRINAESEEQDLVKQMKIQAYPTLIFFDANGVVLYRVEGAPEVEQLLQYGKKASALPLLLKNGWKSNSENLTAYLEALATHQPQQAEKIASEFLAKFPQEDLIKDENWWILAEYVKDASDPSWQYALNNATTFAAKYGGFLNYVESLGEVILNKAVELKDPKLILTKTDLDVLIRRVQGDSSLSREQMQLWNSISYFERIEAENEYTSTLHQYLKKYCWEEPRYLTYYASKIFSGNHAPAVYTNAIQWAERALVLNKDNYVTYWILAIGYSKTNNLSKSNVALQNFLSQSKTDPELPDKVNILLTAY